MEDGKPRQAPRLRNVPLSKNRLRIVVACLLGITGMSVLVHAIAAGGPIFLGSSASRWLLDSSEGRSAADRADSLDPRVVALDRLLAERSQAVLQRRRAQWLATVDPQSTRFLAAQAQTFDNFESVPFGAWTYDVQGQPMPATADERARLGSSAWTIRVVAGYQIRGYDEIPSTSELSVTVVQRQGRWLLAGLGTTADNPGVQLWDFGSVSVVRGSNVIVLGTADRDALRRYAEKADQAISRVSEVWGVNWPRRAVLLVPRTQSQFGHLLRRGKEGLDQLAAVTTGTNRQEIQSTTGEAPVTDDAGVANEKATKEPPDLTSGSNDRIVLNPSAFSKLRPLGQRVVLTHEMTHVAVRRTTPASVPIWLSEGFADYVAYLGTGVSRKVAAEDLLMQVRAGKGPRSLPTTADFDPTKATIAPAYAGGWLACSLIADSVGQRRLVGFYRRSAALAAERTDGDTDAAVDLAFASDLRTNETAFTAKWRKELKELADS